MIFSRAYKMKGADHPWTRRIVDANGLKVARQASKVSLSMNRS